MKYAQIREEIVNYGKLMLSTSLVVGTWGNISARIPGEKLMAITPSGVGYDVMKPEDVVVMDLEGNVVDGNMKPSIEFGLHMTIYKGRDDVSGIIHTHSTYVTAHAIARKGIAAAAEDLVQIVGGDVRVSEYRLPGTPELGVEALKAMKNRNAVIMANHGLVGAARDLKEAYKIVNVVEKSAQANVFAMLLGGVAVLSDEDVDIMRDFYLNAYGQR